MSVLTAGSKSSFEWLSLLIGVLALLSSILYILDKYAIISIAYEFSTETLLMVFSLMTLISGIVLIFSTIGMIGLK